MFINNKDDNSVRDDEIEDVQEKKFSLFKKKNKIENKPTGVDYNDKYLNNNKNNDNDWFKVLRTIFCFVIVIVLVLVFVPKLLHYDNNGRKTYIENVSNMVDQIILYYTRDDVKCSTESKDRYYFEVNDSKEMFGEDIRSPFIKNSLEGYVEFKVTGDNQYEVYVSFTDGFFGFDKVKYSKLKPSDVKIFSYLSLEHHTEMVCDKPFVFSN